MKVKDYEVTGDSHPPETDEPGYAEKVKAVQDFAHPRMTET